MELHGGRCTLPSYHPPLYGAPTTLPSYHPSQVSYTAHALTLEDYMPLALSRDLSGPQALKQHASPLGSTLLLCWELIRCSPEPEPEPEPEREPEPEPEP